MNVLVVGGTGFVGSHLCRLLAGEGHRVTAAGLAAGEPVPGTRWLPCDRRDSRVFDDQLGREDVDAIVDLVAYREDETRRMVRLFAGRIGCFVQLSTLSVFAAAHATDVTEENAVRAGAPDSYGGSKGLCEKVLEQAFRDQGFPAVILRSAPLMGPGDPVSREHYFLKRLLAGWPIFMPGAPGAHLTTLYVEDLARAVLEVLRRPQAIGRDYNLAQAERVTLEDHVENIARLSGTTPAIAWARQGDGPARNPFAFPYAPLDFAAWVDTARAQRELAFDPMPYPVALERTVSWLLRSPSWPAWPGHGSVQCSLAGTHEWLEADAERRRQASDDGGGREAAAVPGRSDEDLSPDQILQSLCTSDEHTSCTFVTRAAWAGSGRALVATARESRVRAEWGNETMPDAAPGHVTARGPVVVMPEQLYDRLGDDVRGGDSEIGGVSGDCRLAAVFEPVAGAASTYRLFTERGARRAQGYRFSNAPPVVQCVSFAEFDWNRDVPAGTRLLATTFDTVSDDALRRWRDAWAAAGCWRIPSLQRCGRVFLAGSERLARRHGRVCLTFDLCRLLGRSTALAGDSPFDLELSGDRHYLFPALESWSRQGIAPVHPSFQLVRIGGRYFVARLAPAAVLEVTTAVAALLEAIATCGDDGMSIAPALAATLKLNTTRAAAVVENGWGVLANAGLVLRV